ncbi:MAG: helix-turn-helix domain-containing protein [Deltaproteobacteria bacterium]|nr:helix-turn-helix domain-containing protein [Deltaproteobacteria bacterium]
MRYRSRHAVGHIVAAAEAAGLPCPRPDALTATGEVVELEAIYALWEALLAAGARCTLAADAAIRAQASSRNLVRMIAGTAPTVGEAAACVAQCWPLVTNGSVVTVRRAPDFGLTFGPVAARAGARLDLLYSLASFARYLTSWCDGPIAGGRLRLRDPLDARDIAALEELLDVAVEARAPEDGLVYPAAIARRALRHADRGLHAHLLEQALARLATVGPPTWTQRVWAALADAADEDDIARALEVSPRTLRRALADEATSFRALRERWREERAHAGLATADDEALAARLGYADARAFRRAFQRWTGVTPEQRRRGR